MINQKQSDVSGFIVLNNIIVKKALTNISSFCIMIYEIGKSRSVVVISLYIR